MKTRQSTNTNGRQFLNARSGLAKHSFNREWLRTATLVPVPPSKVKTDLEYDDRMVQICTGINAPFTVDVRELVVQRESIRTVHGNPDCRPDVRELLDIYEIDEKGANPLPGEIGIVDDVLTAGTHFKAMQKILQSRFPNVPIYGIFVARRVFPDDDPNASSDRK